MAVTQVAHTGRVPGDYDALLLVSFGGPEGPDDVLPFLRNVTHGRAVPTERLLAVVERYQSFGGVSPINGINRALREAVQADFAGHGLDLPVYWGNRNWHPLLTETMAEMAHDGVQRCLAFVTSAYASFSACRQYQDDVAAARSACGPNAPVVDKLRHYFNHPGFIGPNVDAVAQALAELPADRRGSTHLVFTAHSIPVGMARRSGPLGGLYVRQLRAAAGLVAALAAGDRPAAHLPWELAWQSRSGPPQVPWLEPDVNDHLRAVAAAGGTDVVVSPIGFVSDHMEVVWDLDVEAAATAADLGLGFARAATAGADPRFVAMVRELIVERITPGRPAPALGSLGPSYDTCPIGCCPSPPAVRPATGPD